MNLLTRLIITELLDNPLLRSNMWPAFRQHPESPDVPHVRRQGERHHWAAVAGRHQRLPAPVQKALPPLWRSPHQLLLGPVCGALLRNQVDIHFIPHTGWRRYICWWSCAVIKKKKTKKNRNHDGTGAKTFQFWFLSDRNVSHQHWGSSVCVLVNSCLMFLCFSAKSGAFPGLLPKSSHVTDDAIRMWHTLTLELSLDVFERFPWLFVYHPRYLALSTWGRISPCIHILQDYSTWSLLL